MNDDKRLIDRHVGELLSGFVDGELTQQQRQLVTLHCSECKRCQENLDELKALHQRIKDAGLSEVGEDNWRENMNDPGVHISRNIGWFMFVGGLMVVAGIGIFMFIFNDEIPFGVKFLMIAIYGGLATLLFSVLRQRLIERKTDKYKDVEI